MQNFPPSGSPFHVFCWELSRSIKHPRVTFFSVQQIHKGDHSHIQLSLNQHLTEIWVSLTSWQSHTPFAETPLEISSSYHQLTRDISELLNWEEGETEKLWLIHLPALVCHRQLECSLGLLNQCIPHRHPETELSVSVHSRVTAAWFPW